jgi:hypothetical protein
VRRVRTESRVASCRRSSAPPPSSACASQRVLPRCNAPLLRCNAPHRRISSWRFATAASCSAPVLLSAKP